MLALGDDRHLLDHGGSSSDGAHKLALLCYLNGNREEVPTYNHEPMMLSHPDPMKVKFPITFQSRSAVDEEALI